MPRKQSDIFKHYAEIKENGKVVKYIASTPVSLMLLEMPLNSRNTSKNVKKHQAV